MFILYPWLHVEYTYLLTQKSYEGNVSSVFSRVRSVMSHAVKLNMKHKYMYIVAVFSPVNTIIQTSIGLKVLLDNELKP